MRGFSTDLLLASWPPVVACDGRHLDGRRTLRKPPLPALPPVCCEDWCAGHTQVWSHKCNWVSASCTSVAASAQCLESAADSNDYCGLQGGVSSQRWCCRPKRRISLWRAKDRLACRFRRDPAAWRHHVSMPPSSRSQSAATTALTAGISTSVERWSESAMTAACTRAAAVSPLLAARRGTVCACGEVGRVPPDFHHLSLHTLYIVLHGGAASSLVPRGLVYELHSLRRPLRNSLTTHSRVSHALNLPAVSAVTRRLAPRRSGGQPPR